MLRYCGLRPNTAGEEAMSMKKTPAEQALSDAWEAINALGGIATTEEDKRYIATLALITGYIKLLQELL